MTQILVVTIPAKSTPVLTLVTQKLREHNDTVGIDARTMQQRTKKKKAVKNSKIAESADQDDRAAKPTLLCPCSGASQTRKRSRDAAPA